MERHCHGGIPVQAEKNLESAVENTLADAGEDDVIIAFGSLSYLGDVMLLVQNSIIFR